MPSDVVLNFSGFDKVAKEASGAANNPDMSRLLKRLAAVYRGDMQKRFVKYSRGGGDWAPLAESTKQQRRGDGNKAAILRDTSTMFLVLSPALLAPGALEKREEKGIRVGFGGPAQHPKAEGFSISDLANAHHQGKGNLPARPILDQPSTAARRIMSKEVQSTLQALLNQADQTNVRPF